MVGFDVEGGQLPGFEFSRRHSFLALSTTILDGNHCHWFSQLLKTRTLSLTAQQLLLSTTGDGHS
jgi:hypothetical protein